MGLRKDPPSVYHHRYLVANSATLYIALILWDGGKSSLGSDLSAPAPRSWVLKGRGSQSLGTPGCVPSCQEIGTEEDLGVAQLPAVLSQEDKETQE